MKFHSPRQPFSSNGSSHVKNSENREWSSSVHTQRPDRNNRGHRAASASAGRRDTWAAAGFGSEGRDTRQRGCGEVSRPLRSRWHPVRKLSFPYPKVDRRNKRSTKAMKSVTTVRFRSAKLHGGEPHDRQTR